MWKCKKTNGLPSCLCSIFKWAQWHALNYAIQGKSYKKAQNEFIRIPSCWLVIRGFNSLPRICFPRFQILKLNLYFSDSEVVSAAFQIPCKWCINANCYRVNGCMWILINNLGVETTHASLMWLFQTLTSNCKLWKRVELFPLFFFIH